MRWSMRCANTASITSKCRQRRCACGMRSKRAPENDQEVCVSSQVIFETSEDRLDVVLNRPDEGNLISNDMGQEIAHALRNLSPAIKLVRLRGAGANFCKGRQ